jgi:hypothetical protein
MGYHPRMLFFNAFELGVVIWEDAHIRARKELEARESIKKKIWNNFKSKPLPMKKILVTKQVMKAQSNKHRKENKCNFKNFNTKRGNLILSRCIKPCFPLS